jgi:hypothetical protein
MWYFLSQFFAEEPRVGASHTKPSTRRGSSGLWTFRRPLLPYRLRRRVAFISVNTVG